VILGLVLLGRVTYVNLISAMYIYVWLHLIFSLVTLDKKLRNHFLVSRDFFSFDFCSH
jgi:hypothetical protein